MANIKIRFWGIRGSAPAPSKETVKYGGNTPCMEIVSGKDLIICDCGTGLRFLGEKLIRSRRTINAAIFVSHIHWDHISGLPFFRPIYYKENSFKIFGPKPIGMSLKNALNRAISPPFFPVALKNIPAKMTFKDVATKTVKYSNLKVTPFLLSHPGGALGWRFEFPGGKSVVYVSDNEPSENKNRLIKWVNKADIMIHDAQYTLGEYKKHQGWGHSPYNYPIDIAKTAGVKNLILSHFDPTHSDKMMDEINKKLPKNCQLAFEGKVVEL